MSELTCLIAGFPQGCKSSLGAVQGDKIEQNKGSQGFRTEFAGSNMETGKLPCIRDSLYKFTIKKSRNTTATKNSQFPLNF